MNSESIGIGDTCYTVGLFRLMAGERRNLPAVHSGNIALLPGDEKIPIKDWDDPRRRRHVEGYLVESQSLRGLSGSPVFVRPVIDFLDLPVEFGGKLEQTAVRLQKRDLLLLGLWIGAWDAPPDEVMAVDRGDQTRVPVGMGTVVPASKIIEVLEVPELIERRRLLEEQRATSAASLDATGVAHSGGNPSEGVEG